MAPRGGISMSENAMEPVWLEARPGERFLVRVPAEATGGAYAVVEVVSSVGDKTPLHVHTKEEEYILVVDGRLRAQLGEEIIEAGPGEMLTLPRNIPHAWGNAGDTPLRMMVTASPGGCERALIAAARRDAAFLRDGEIDIAALGQRFGVTMIGPANI
jgi:quercetin dioxygenase-like cupin family protein